MRRRVCERGEMKAEEEEREEGVWAFCGVAVCERSHKPDMWTMGHKEGIVCCSVALGDVWT